MIREHFTFGSSCGQPGALTVPAHLLHDIVRKLPDGSEVELKRDTDKDRVTLSKLREAHEGWFPRFMGREEIPLTN